MSSACRAPGERPLLGAIEASDEGAALAALSAGWPVAELPAGPESEAGPAVGPATGPATGSSDAAEPGPAIGPPLVAAAAAGMGRLVEALISRGANPNSRDPSGASAVLAAVRGGHAAVIARLIARGADPHAPDHRDDTPLAAAAARGDLRAVTLLLAAGARLDWVGRAALGDASAGSPLFAAARHRRFEAMARLIDAGAPLEAPIRAGNRRSVLGWACLWDDAETIELLTDHGAPVEEPRRGRAGALFTAAEHCGPDSLALILRAARRVDPRDAQGVTPLMVAVSAGNGDAVAALIAQGADIDALDGEGGSVLLRAVRDVPGRRFVVRLLAAGADPDLTDFSAETYTTPLIAAVEAGQPKLVRQLLAAGADPELPDSRGLSPLAATHLARRGDPANARRYRAIVAQLRLHGARQGGSLTWQAYEATWEGLARTRWALAHHRPPRPPRPGDIDKLTST